MKREEFSELIEEFKQLIQGTKFENVVECDEDDDVFIVSMELI